MPLGLRVWSLRLPGHHWVSRVPSNGIFGKVPQLSLSSNFPCSVFCLPPSHMSKLCSDSPPASLHPPGSPVLFRTTAASHLLEIWSQGQTAHPLTPLPTLPGGSRAHAELCCCKRQKEMSEKSRQQEMQLVGTIPAQYLPQSHGFCVGSRWEVFLTAISFGNFPMWNALFMLESPVIGEPDHFPAYLTSELRF